MATEQIEKQIDAINQLPYKYLRIVVIKALHGEDIITAIDMVIEEYVSDIEAIYEQYTKA